MKNNKNLVAGIFAAIGASLCCITPVLALLGGVSGLATSFSWIDPYRPFFIGATVLIFALAWYQKIKPKPQIDCECESENKISFWQTKTFLTIITIVATLFIAFPYYAKIFYPKPHVTKFNAVNKSTIKTAQLYISGMDCEGCTTHINSELLKVTGVIEANTSYKNGNATVTFDTSKTSVTTIANTINAIGYKITSTYNNK